MDTLKEKEKNVIGKLSFLEVPQVSEQSNGNNSPRA